MVFLGIIALSVLITSAIRKPLNMLRAQSAGADAARQRLHSSVAMPQASHQVSAVGAPSVPGTKAIEPWRGLGPRSFVMLMREAIAAWNADYAPSMGAALAYYTAFSLAPLLLIAITVAGAIFGEEAARGQVTATLGSLVGGDAAKAIEEMIKTSSESKGGVLASVIGIVTLIVGATSVFGELQSALDRIWRAPQQQQRSGLLALLRGRLLSFGLVVSLGFLLLVSLLISSMVAALGSVGSRLLPGWEVLLQVLNAGIGFAITGVMFAVIYRVLPSVRIPWRDVWTGAWMTAALFTIGKTLIGLYIGKAAPGSVFGAAGSMVIMLVWVYYSAQVFLLGAEFTWVYAQHDRRRALAERKSVWSAVEAPGTEG